MYSSHPYSPKYSMKNEHKTYNCWKTHYFRFGQEQEAAVAGDMSIGPS